MYLGYICPRTFITLYEISCNYILFILRLIFIGLLHNIISVIKIYFSFVGRWPWFEFDRCGYRNLRGARLEPNEGPSSHGPRPPHWTKEGCQRVPTHHQRNPRGEDYGVCLIIVLR